jgi:hypothetical protein
LGDRLVDAAEALDDLAEREAFGHVGEPLDDS